MKKILLGLMVFAFAFFLAGCSNLGKYAGTYVMEYGKFVGDPDTSKDTTAIEKMVLEDDGTGKSVRDGLNIDVEWHMDGENITLVEKYMGITLEYNGTLKDNKLDLFNGDKEEDLTYEKVYNKE